MTELQPIARFPLPADWQPVGTRCYIVTVPDDDEYGSILIGLVDDLRWSRNFGRDTTRTGAGVVARTFSEAIEAYPVTRIDCELARAIIMGITINVNCNCSGCGCGDGSSGNEGQVTPSTPELTACTIMSGWHVWLANEMATLVGAGRSQAEAANDIMGQLAAYGANEVTRGYLYQLYAFVEAAIDLAELLTECYYLPVYQLLRGLIEEDPTVAISQLRTWLMVNLTVGQNSWIEVINLAGATLTGAKLWQFAQAHAESPCVFGDDCTGTSTESTVTYDEGGYEPYTIVRGLEAVLLGNPGDGQQGEAYLDPNFGFGGWHNRAILHLDVLADGQVSLVECDAWIHWPAGVPVSVGFYVRVLRGGVVVETHSAGWTLAYETWALAKEIFAGTMSVQEGDVIEVIVGKGWNSSGDAARDQAIATVVRIDNIHLEHSEGVL